ncbi:response regulator [Pseudochryseolinea flava]|uniref:Response regulatory domain-containing protein n=1 Tax=Pseudochryseolinea flava TaxID=2059302 RepID=A0A364Y1Z7_9BACT|nr:response regulator [Pseudochryseolinea flava]RAV99989.1 hypothetical protein DQQ10_15640 [Pseudochryseolinea flava]
MKSCLHIDNDPDDQDYFIDTVHQISSTAGCFAVSNTEEAFLTLISQNLTPDYIFVSLELPVIDGFQFLERIKKIPQFSGIPVVMLTSNYSTEIIEKATKFGASAIYSKTRRDALRQILAPYFGR